VDNTATTGREEATNQQLQKVLKLLKRQMYGRAKIDLL